MFSALAVAAELAARGWQISWLGTPDSFESRVVPAHGFDLDTIEAQRVRGEGLARRLLALWGLLHAMRQAAGVLRRRRPAVVLGMGGFVTAPGGVVSRLLRIPLVIHEQNAIPGMTNRMLARFATRVLQAFPGSFAAAVDARVTGNPIRAEIAALPAPQPIGDRRLRLLVFGGSQGAQALNEGVPAALALIDEDLRPEVRHQAGRDRHAATAAAYRSHAVDAEIVEFIDDMDAAYRWADLAICRAGALTVSELMAAGLPAVLVPFPYAVDDHQSVNAGFLADADAGRLLQQRDMTPQALAATLSDLMSDRDALHAIALRAYGLARRDAAARVADVCAEVIA